jgi:hypothetical protein
MFIYIVWWFAQRRHQMKAILMGHQFNCLGSNARLCMRIGTKTNNDWVLGNPDVIYIYILNILYIYISTYYVNRNDPSTRKKKTEVQQFDGGCQNP